MIDIPNDLKYTPTHEWVRFEEDGTVTVGITDHAQHLLGELLFISLPHLGRELREGEEFAVVESGKAAADIYVPVDGEVLEINEALTGTPELINNDPYGDGWLLRLKPYSIKALDYLLDAKTYRQHIRDEYDEC